ncbi:hypothetical protein [Pseudomonas sp. dw_612]|uniref:hypothetical protein n=1 Tax=Pseudomonas sp. dw_612 TaxID=2720080 RepID=UPI001BD69F57|nr:hypothetical protein [Pseudomonas sp. dw_612]
MNDGKSQIGQQAFSGGNVPNAAVVGASVVSFGAGMSTQDREDIYLSNMFAQMATRSAYQDGLVGNWFDYYTNKLRYLGWDAVSPVGSVPARAAFMADNICQQISQSFGERFSSPANRAFESLRRNPIALDGFEGASLSRDSGVFQVIPCVQNRAGKIEIALYHKQFSTRRRGARFLFWPMDDIVKTSQERMALVTFSTLHYATFREKVAAAVLSESTRNLHALEI